MDTRTCVKLKASIWSFNDVSVSEIQSRCPCWPFPDYCAPFSGNISSLCAAPCSLVQAVRLAHLQLKVQSRRELNCPNKMSRVPSQLSSCLAPLFQMKLLAWLPEPNLSARNGRISLLPIPAGTCRNWRGGVSKKEINLKTSDFAYFQVASRHAQMMKN